MAQVDIRSILTQDISPYLLKVYAPYIEEAVQDFRQFSSTASSGDFATPPRSLEDKATQLIGTEDPVISFFLQQINGHIADFSKFKKIFIENEQVYSAANNKEEQKRITLDFARQLGETEKNLREDEIAFARWFDFDAVLDRYHEQVAEIQRKLHFLIERFRYINSTDPGLLDYFLKIGESFQGDYRINLVALDTLVALIKKAATISPDFIEHVSNIIAQPEGDIWCRIKYMEILSLKEIKKFIFYFDLIFTSSLKNHEKSLLLLGNQIFLREGIVKLLVNIQSQADIKKLVSKVQKDPGAYVRQSLCRYLTEANYGEGFKVLENIILNDPAKSVKAQAILGLTKKTIEENKLEEFLSVVVKVLENEQDIFVLRVIIKAIEDIITSLPSEIISKNSIIAITAKLINENFPIAVKRWAAELNLKLWCIKEPKLWEIKKKLQGIIDNILVGTKLEIRDTEINNIPFDDMGKILSIIAKSDFDIEFWQMGRVYVVSRGVKMQFRLWRFLHEMFVSSPDKRQNYRHTVGRVYYGENLVLSGTAELSETLVPGEPLHIQEEESNRPFLPLVDYCLSVIDKGKEAYIFSPEGITKLTPPSAFSSRIYASLLLTLKFKDIAKLRNWTKSSLWTPENYINKLREFGFKITFEEYKGQPSSEDTKGFFKTYSVMPFIGSLDILDYFLSPHGNNLLSLAIFILTISALWGIYRYNSYKKHIKKRSSIPLVIGGWGTRGKTGSERLKAAMFNSLGLRLVSKTTGCEATIVIADPYSRMQEIPVYRPYNQSTIWEQRDILKFAYHFEAEVFLWECMALRGEYVDILQTEWMQDDISTITNAHPDHEDIQGPTGMDVAKTIASFIPSKGRILTSEQQMLAILKEVAKEKGTKLESCSWLEAGLISEDILSLFPYYEHPSNISLIMKLAQQVGIDTSYALKWIIDKVIPDIGALKVFIPCNILGRTISFTNGMSANEEVGCISNWKRLKFDEFDIKKQPSVFISTIVNNRGDRAQRSRIFARIIASTLFADRHFLIGTDICGLKNNILKAWNKFLADLVKTMQTSGQPLLLLEETFKKLHICTDEEDKQKRVGALKAYDDPKSIEEAEKFKQEIIADYESYLSLKKIITEGNIPAKEITVLLSGIFARKIIVIKENNPDEIMVSIIKNTPPGYENQLIGIQNIKNPGIDFVRSWHQWEKCHKACEVLTISQDEKQIEDALESIAEFDFFNILARDYVKNIINNIKIRDDMKIFTLTIQKILNDIEKSQQIFTNFPPKKVKVNIFKKVFREILDMKKLTEQKKMAEQIYEDLLNKRISMHRARTELRKYNLN